MSYVRRLASDFRSRRESDFPEGTAVPYKLCYHYNQR